MLDLDEMKKNRERSSRDKSDLFDFYDWAYDELVKEIYKLRAELEWAKCT